jgi:acylphosphatase
MAVQAKRVVVHGRVQGVGFRYFVQKLGTRLGLVGDVRNRPDGTVEIVVEGEEEVVGAFLREVAVGPALSRVERVEVSPIAPGGSQRRFGIEGW